MKILKMAIACLMVGSAQAEMSSVSAAEELKKNFPQLQIDKMALSPLEGLLEVQTNNTVFYVTPNGRYLLLGDLLDLGDNKKNLTEEARKKQRLKGLAQIEPKDVIVFPAKEPKYTVTVFTDIDCSYCRQFHEDREALNARGISLRYLAFPRAGVNSETGEKMKRIWCASDRKAAMTAAMQGHSFPSESCDNHPVEKELAYGLSIGVRGTPTVMFEDGTLFPGYLSPDQLLEIAKQARMAPAQKSKKAS